MTNFIIVLICIALFLVRKTGGKILCNELFWLCIFWFFIIGIFLFGGTKYYGYGTSIQVFLFLVAVAFAFWKGRNDGYKKTKKAIISVVNVNHSKLYTVLGVLGLLIYVLDVIRLNGILFLIVDTGTKADIETSFLGGVGSLFIPILLVQGIYLFNNDLVQNDKINIAAVCYLLLYTIPCIFHTGREAILYIIIAITASFGYKKIVNRTKVKFNIKKFVVTLIAIAGVIFLMHTIVNISKGRFGQNEINVFLSKHTVESSAIAEASKWGEFEFLYYNFLSYFSHQIPFLDFTLQKYDGPYMLGMFELNIISRRLPDFIGLDYTQVYEKLNTLYNTSRITFKGSWNTVLGSLICDFGWLGTIIICYFLGKITGIIRKKFDMTHSLRYAVIIILFCVSSFATIQLGPFYNILIYGSYIWWYVLYGRGHQIIVSKSRINHETS